jgi:hypothetical protein
VRTLSLTLGLMAASGVASAQPAPAGSAMSVRATRLPAPLDLDGRLDEAIYENVIPMTNFIQTEPQPGTVASERTEVWVLFDDDHVIVSARNWESHPERRVANDMRRDSANTTLGNDNVCWIFDTFHDRQNGYTFAANSLGAFGDGQATNQRNWSGDWNPVWTVRTGRFDQGWTMEAAIPFKSLRYRPGREQTWGFNICRVVRWKNEVSFLSRVPESIGGGNSGILYASFAANLEGLEAPPPARNIEVKPYATSAVATDRTTTPRVENDVSADVGADVKYAVTQNLTADLTVNTDFAQVEADEQQINLTRFNLFFPEKREFFLENQGVFAFGGAGTSGGGDVPILFYSRRIGLSAGHVVPIAAGGRLTGRIGRTTIGALNIQAREDELALAESTNFSALRLKRDVLRKSSIGILATHRSAAQTGGGPNTAFGADGTFAFFDSMYVNAYWARTDARTPGRSDRSYRAQFDYAADRYGLQLEHLRIGDAFDPGIGFVRRTDVRKSLGQFRFSPRPLNNKAIRKLSWTGSVGYYETGSGRLDTRDTDVSFGIDFHSSDRLLLSGNQTYEFVPQPFRIATGVTVPVGGYDYASLRTAYQFGQQRPLSGTIAAEQGSFYGGTKTTIGVSGSRATILTKLSVEPSISINRVRLPQGHFTTKVIGSRVTYTMTPRMFTSALVQYGSGNNVLAVNARLRWEYQPGSELFIVLNEQRDTRRPGYELSNRSFIIKVNRLFRF